MCAGQRGSCVWCTRGRAIYRVCKRMACMAQSPRSSPMRQGRTCARAQRRSWPARRHPRWARPSHEPPASPAARQAGGADSRQQAAGKEVSRQEQACKLLSTAAWRLQCDPHAAQVANDQDSQLQAAWPTNLQQLCSLPQRCPREVGLPVRLGAGGRRQLRQALPGPAVLHRLGPEADAQHAPCSQRRAGS